VHEVGHLHGRGGVAVAAVAELASSTVDCLLHRVTGENAKHDWDAGVRVGAFDTARGTPDDGIVVGSLAAHNAADGDDSAVVTGEGEALSGEWELHAARNPRNLRD